MSINGDPKRVIVPVKFLNPKQILDLLDNVIANIIPTKNMYRRKKKIIKRIRLASIVEGFERIENDDRYEIT